MGAAAAAGATKKFNDSIGSSIPTVKVPPAGALSGRSECHALAMIEGVGFRDVRVEPVFGDPPQAFLASAVAP